MMTSGGRRQPIHMDIDRDDSKQSNTMQPSSIQQQQQPPVSYYSANGREKAMQAGSASSGGPAPMSTFTSADMVPGGVGHAALSQQQQQQQLRTGLTVQRQTVPSQMQAQPMQIYERGEGAEPSGQQQVQPQGMPSRGIESTILSHGAQPYARAIEMPSSIEELRRIWAEYAPTYTSHYEPCTLSLARTLIQALQLRDATGRVVPANRVLEVGSASGAAAVELTTQLTPQSIFTVTDIAPEFVLFAETRLKFFPNVKVMVADGEHLPFLDNSFDRYFSNLTLNFVLDPDQMLKEAFRVLQPGGVAAFSVWGREEFSYMHTIIPKVFKQLDIDVDSLINPDSGASSGASASPTVKGRSDFYLGKDMSALRERVLRAGFRTVCLWYQPMVMDVLDGEVFADRMLASDPQYIRLAGTLSADRWRSVREGVSQVADTLLSCGIPISLDALVVVARK